MVRLGDDDLSRQEQERLRLIQEAKKNPKPSINKADAYTRGIFGILSGNEQILTAAIKGSNEDFLEVSSQMSDAELAGNIVFFVAFSLAGRVGNKLGKMNSKGGKTTSFKRVSEYAKSKGFKLSPDIKPKVQAEINRVNNLGDVKQQEGLLRIRESKLQAAQDLLKNITDKTEKFKLKADIEGIKRSIQQGVKDLADANLREQVESMNKLDRNIQFKLEKGNIVRDAAKELSNKVEDLNKEGGYMGKYKYKIENGKIIIDRPKASEIAEEKLSNTIDENIRQAQKLIEEGNRREQLAKEAREQAKAEDKAIDEDPDFDEKGEPDGDKVIETKEKLSDKDQPNFDDNAEAKETDPLMEREQSTEEMIDESIERNRQEREGVNKVKTALKTGGAAILTAELANKITNNDNDNDDDPEFENPKAAPQPGENMDGDDEPPVIPMDLVEEIEVLPDAAQVPTVSLPGVSKQEFKIIETTNVENNDRYFDQTLYYATLVYDSDFERAQELKDPITKVGNDKYVCLIKQDRRDLFVSFRGTNNFHNAIIDLTTEDSLMDNLKMARSLLSQNDEIKNRIHPENMKIKFHAGFLAMMLRFLYFKVIEQLKAFSGTVDHIILTGHSMGAALAGIFYYLYETDTGIDEDDRIPIQRCITYASPRYVRNDPLYIDLYNTICPNLTRIFNIDDIVSYLPFNQPLSISGLNLLSGFKHVGVPRCLNGENKNNNINTYTVTKLQSQFSIQLYNELLKDDDIRKTEEDIKELLYSKTFNSILIGSLLQCITRKQCPPVDDKIILHFTAELQNVIKEKFTYDEKIKKLSILGIEDILELNQVGEDPRQQNIGLPALFGMIYNTSMNTIYYHSTKYYRLLLDKAIQLEAKDKRDINQPIGLDSELNKNTEQKRAIELRLNKQISDLKEVQGIIYTDRDITEPVFIRY